ncbi:MAG: CDP-alcohol phosphatidyltransferase family protein [Rhodobacteraceae bacterium]|jgi:phosphatidylglycerophosphate synthase|nr:CDP-alcohol phosphatidyltransferase family protein [Paracoccaceae bacterium]
MFDGWVRRRIDPALDRAGRALAARGVPADAVTLAGLALGLASAALIAAGATVAALVPLVLSRLADGLDGAVARATRPSDWGGYIDIAADFLFYGAVPFAFVLLDPAANGAAGAFLLLTFYVNGATFLGFAVLAARAGLTEGARARKSLYFTAGILEGTETIAFLILICLLPGAFAPLAWGFGAVCLLTAGARTVLAFRLFRGGSHRPR